MWPAYQHLQNYEQSPISSMIFLSCQQFQLKNSDLVHEVADEPLEVLGSVLCGLQHLFVIRLLIAVIVCHDLVGNEGQTQDAQATVASHHHLWHCTHTWI